MALAKCTVLGVRREERYSPGKVGDDGAILTAALEKLAPAGTIPVISPEQLGALPRRPSLVLSMAQSPQALDILEDWEQSGTRVVNSSRSVRRCYRRPMIQCLAGAGITIPPSSLYPLADVPSALAFVPGRRFWLKRGDVHAMQPNDVVAVSSPDELEGALRHYSRNGVKEVLVQEHVDGEVVKFYGVGPEDYFCAFSGCSGQPAATPPGNLAALARKAASAAGLEVYGGDAVLTADGRTILIDLNDWPSFSRCRPAAAEKIAAYVNRITEGGLDEGSGRF